MDMLSKLRRLSRKDFLIVKSRGIRSGFRQLNVVYLKTDLGNTRFSVVTSKKFHKLAVVRNSFRRHLYRLLADTPGSFDIILIPSPSMLKLSYEEIYSLLAQLLSSLSLNS